MRKTAKGEMRERQHGWMEIHGTRDRITLAESFYGGRRERQRTAKCGSAARLCECDKDSVFVWVYKCPGFKKQVHSNYQKSHLSMISLV